MGLRFENMSLYDTMVKLYKEAGLWEKCGKSIEANKAYFDEMEARSE